MLHDTPTHKKHCSLAFLVCRWYQPVYTRVGTSKSFFFSKVSNLHVRSGIGWIERRIKFQIFPIFIFWVMVISGPNCPGPNWPSTELSWYRIVRDRIVLVPNCPGPNCPGPNCPGPNCPDLIELISLLKMINVLSSHLFLSTTFHGGRLRISFVTLQLAYVFLWMEITQLFCIKKEHD